MNDLSATATVTAINSCEESLHNWKAETVEHLKPHKERARALHKKAAIATKNAAIATFPWGGGAQHEHQLRTVLNSSQNTAFKTTHQVASTNLLNGDTLWIWSTILLSLLPCTCCTYCSRLKSCILSRVSRM